MRPPVAATAAAFRPVPPGLWRWRALHRTTLALTLATALAHGRGGWSWRGQGPEAALFVAAWGSAAWLWLGHRRHLSRPGKWYFGGAALFPLLPFVGWLPAAYALIPNRVLYESPAFALRDQNRGFLDGRRLALVLPVAGIGERLAAFSDDWPRRPAPPGPAPALRADDEMPMQAVPDSVLLTPRPGGGHTARLYVRGREYRADFLPAR